jgi:hypothetical protein
MSTRGSYAPAVVASALSGQRIAAVSVQDPGLDEAERSYKERIAAAHAFDGEHQTFPGEAGPLEGVPAPMLLSYIPTTTVFCSCPN